MSEGQIIDIKRVNYNNDVCEKSGWECNDYDALST